MQNKHIGSILLCMRVACGLLFLSLVLSCGGPLVPNQDATDLYLATQNLDLVKEIRIKNYTPGDKALSLLESRGPYFVPFMANRPKGVLTLAFDSSDATSGVTYKSYLVDDGSKSSTIDLGTIGPQFDLIESLRIAHVWPKFFNKVRANLQTFVSTQYESTLAPDAELVAIEALDPNLVDSGVIWAETRILPSIATDRVEAKVPFFDTTYTKNVNNNASVVVGATTFGFPTLSGSASGTKMLNNVYVIKPPGLPSLRQFGYSISGGAPSYGFVDSNSLTPSDISLIASSLSSNFGYVACQTDLTGLAETNGNFSLSFIDPQNRVRSFIVRSGASGTVEQMQDRLILHLVGPDGAGKIALEIKDNNYYFKGEYLAPSSPLFRYTTWASDYASGNQWAIFAQILVNYSNQETVIRTYAKKY